MKNKQIKIISRRDFLKLSGLTIGGVTAGRLLCSELMAIPRHLLDQVAHGSGEESWINTVCRQCPGGCGITVRRIDGLPVYLKGNPVFPVNRGGVCPMAHSSMEILFNPDRVKNPLKRDGAKGNDRWVDTNWDQALTSLIQRLQALVLKGAGHKIALINGDSSPLMRTFCRYWMKTVGSPHYYEDEELRNNTVAVRLSQNIDETPAYDLANSKYILNFGSNFLEEGSSPVYYQQLFGHMRSTGKAASTILVHIDSRINLTASNSDRWIPIRPGTYAALALGIAYILIVNKLYDKDFIRSSHGFNSFRDDQNREHTGFESYVRANYYPEKVSQITGVSTETIIQLGKEFGFHKPAIAIADNAARYSTNGSYTQWAIYCLNALVGNIQKKGGVYFTPPLPEFDFPDVPLSSKSQNSLSTPVIGSNIGTPSLLDHVTIDRFAEAIVSGPPDQIDTLIIVDANPVFHSRNKGTIIKALQRIKKVISLGIFIDETAKHCDLILPDHSYLEKTDISGPIPGFIFSHLGLQQPVINPVFDTQQAGDILITIGKALGGEDVYPWQNYKAVVRRQLERIYNSGEGAIISELSGAEWIKYLRERGWKLQQYETFGSFQKLLVKNGGWWNPVDPHRRAEEIFRTESRKFEFYSSVLAEKLAEKSTDPQGTFSEERQNQLLNSLHLSARGDELLLPHYEPPYTQGQPTEFPLILTVSQLLTNRNGKGASQPSMMEMVGIQVEQYWKSWIEINPETAEEYGLVDQKLAWVESTTGRVQVDVRFFQGIRPGVIHLHLGLGHTSYGQYGTGIGVNATDLIENNNDPLTNLPALNGARVKVNPVLRGI